MWPRPEGTIGVDVCLHIGAHRTATTTLQRVLGGNRPRLSAGGVAYWGPRRTRGGLFSGLMTDPGHVLPWQVRRQGRTAGLIRLEIERLRQAGLQSLIVSEENMIGPLRATVDGAMLYPQAADRLARFAPGFDTACTRVGLSIRCYDAFWTSALAFRLARGGPAPTPALRAALVDQPRRWRHVIEEACAAFPGSEIVVWTYEARGARPAATVAAFLGRDLALSGARDRHNAAPAPEDLGRVMADRGEDPGLITTAAGRFMPFDAGQRAALRAQYAEDLHWLRAGADGIATLIDDPGHETAGATGQGRGLTHEREHRRLA